jgi:hypothetical protein
MDMAIAEEQIKTLARGVPRMHLATSVLNLLFLVAAVGGYMANVPSLVSVGVMGGYFANALAIVIGIAVMAWLLVSSFTGAAREVWRLHWLAIVNAIVVVLAWALVFSIG